MTSKIVRGAIFFTAILLSSNSALAAGYIGLGFGKASWDIKPLEIFEVDDGTPIRIFGGSRTGKLAFEMEFSLSEHDWTGSGGIITHNADHLIFSGLGFLPLSDAFELYGKIGLNLWSTTVDVDGTEFEGDDGIDLAFGAGFNINAGQHFIIRLEGQYLPGIGDGLDEGDITQFTVNGAYVF
jgi:hypothetical protein